MCVLTVVVPMVLEIRSVLGEKGKVEVARIRVVQEVSYAEAVKRLVEEDGSSVRDPKRLPVSRERPNESDRNNICFS